MHCEQPGGGAYVGTDVEELGQVGPEGESGEAGYLLQDAPQDRRGIAFAGIGMVGPSPTRASWVPTRAPVVGRDRSSSDRTCT